MKTIVSSRKKEIVISDTGPTTLIGERINPSGKKKLAESLKRGDFDLIKFQIPCQEQIRFKL